jgi:subtilisin family serine protease
LALVTFLWTALTAGVLVVSPVRSVPGSLSHGCFAHLHGASATQEPPPEHPLCGGFSGAALLHPKQVEQARGAVVRTIATLGVAEWHKASQRGKGVTIAVLDSGFKGYRASLGTALPAAVKVKSFRKDGDLEARESQHGILCAEVIHHLAPDAELLLANWEPEQPDAFLEAVRWARREGARIITCSLIVPTWSDGEGRGTVHQALRQILGDGGKKEDALFFASAGNTALRHWSGPMHPERDGWHQWAPSKTSNRLRLLTTERVSVELCSRAAALELVLHDATTERDVTRAQSSREECGSAVVRFVPETGHRYSIRVRLLDADPRMWPRGSEEPRFHLTVLGGRLLYATAAGSIPFPGDGLEVVAVGAVDELGRRWKYSSCGPNSTAAKPDLVTTVPFPSVWRAQQPFGGTSAAAPQAAALAALLWGSNPAWTAEQVRLALRNAARRTTPGHSLEMGFGLLRMPPTPPSRARSVAE